MSSSPTSRSLQECRRLGYVAGVVERFNPYSRKSADLWGWCDIVALEPGERLLFIQCTSGSNHANRVAKVREWSYLGGLVQLGNAVEVWSWSRRVVWNKDGSKAKVKRWTLKREVVQ